MADVELNAAMPVAFFVVSLAVTVVMLADVKKGRIPNTLWIMFALGGLLFHAFAPVGRGLEFSLVGAFLAFGLLFMPFLAGGVVTRDLKLTAGVGAWFGPSLTICVFICIAAVASLYHGLEYARHGNIQDSLVKLRIMYCRLASLLRYLAANDDAPYKPEQSGLDDRLVSYATAIFLSTLLMLNFVIFFWK